MERVKPGLRACPKPQASWAIGQCAGGASQNAKALVFQIVGKSLVRSPMGLTGLFWVVQLRFHFFSVVRVMAQFWEDKMTSTRQFDGSFMTGPSTRKPD